MVKYPEWLANVVHVPKNNGKVRVCVDFRDLNKANLKDDLSLPHIDMLVDSTTNHSMLSFMDGFFGVMSFELKNTGATYQRAATTLFHDMMHQDVKIKQFRLRLNPKKYTFGVTSRKLLGYMCHRAFEKIRECLLSPPVLVFPTPSHPLPLCMLVSNIALGCMLAQLDDSGKERAIYYLSYLKTETLHDRVSGVFDIPSRSLEIFV
ncbi:hypothetical protein CK203_097115 [Vitis vinifera]|uniref:Reverse transcriptase/retrotransposon-derived protein RNase H-like domain-containing protein n=1 Tax=Vitis vinifera TaxID=29760 RepID=A0A438BPQ0_VITVI|nr:hypothetical protein CK203_097115 [Vitis vinifera]